MKAFGSAQSQGETAKYNSPFTLDQSKKLSEKSRQFQPLEAAKSTVKDFASSTTIHGITYIFDAAIKILDRLFWILVVACGVFLAVLLSYQAWDDWKSNPVLTSVSSTGLPLRKVDYPAITLCSQGIIQVRI